MNILIVFIPLGIIRIDYLLDSKSCTAEFNLITLSILELCDHFYLSIVVLAAVIRTLNWISVDFCKPCHSWIFPSPCRYIFWFFKLHIYLPHKSFIFWFLSCRLNVRDYHNALYWSVFYIIVLGFIDFFPLSEFFNREAWFWFHNKNLGTPYQLLLVWPQRSWISWLLFEFSFAV